MKRIKSIISGDTCTCYMCGQWCQTEKHHIFGGANRTKSDKDGLVVCLCHACHNEPPYGVHHNRENDLKLKVIAQKRWMEVNGSSIADFRMRYGKNYIDEEE